MMKSGKISLAALAAAVAAGFAITIILAFLLPRAGAPDSVLGTSSAANPIRPDCMSLTAGTTTISLECADTPALSELGLSYRDSLPENHGMLFVFNPPQAAGIWMKGMGFPLDIFWLDSDFKILTLQKSLSPDTYPTPFFPAKPVSYVIELPAGFADAHSLSVGSQFGAKK